MKKNSNKRFHLILCLLFMVLVLFPSCKKTEEKSNANPAVTTSEESTKQSVSTTATTKNESTSRQEVKTETFVEASTLQDKDSTAPVVEEKMTEEVEPLVNETSYPQPAIELVEIAGSVQEVVFIDPSFKLGTLTFNADGSITDYYRYGMAIQAKITIGDECAKIEYVPGSITGDDVNWFISSMVENYPLLREVVTYEVKPEIITFHYPKEIMGGKYYKLLTLSYMNEAVTSILDTVNMANTVYVSVDENNEKTYGTEFVLFDKKANIVASNTKAVITSEKPFDSEEITMAMDILLATNSDLQNVSYNVEGNQIELSYPEVDDTYVKTAVASISNLIQAYTPALLPETGEEPIVEAAMASTTEKEEIIDIPVVPSGETAEDSAVTEETMPIVVVVEQSESSKTKTIAETKAGKKIQYSTKLGINAGYVRGINLGVTAELEADISKNFAVGIKTGYNIANEIPLIPYAKATWKNTYAQAGAGFVYSKNDGFGIIGEVVVGHEFPMEDMFSVFVEAGARIVYQKDKNVKVGGFGTIGGKIKF